MKILVSNDDGINARGIKELVTALSKVAEVYVSAPGGQRSANSHALSISRTIKVKQVDFEGAVCAFEVDGTPADCVKLGLNILKRKGIKIDAVYSGINHGGNLGGDTMYSGTVSAAAEGALAGLPAVAVSVNSHQPSYFEGCTRLAVNLMPYALETAGSGRVVNINAPDIPAGHIKGVRAARLGVFEYDHWFSVVEEDGKEGLYRYSGEPVVSEDWDDDMDVKLIREGWATVSMVQFDYNDYTGYEALKNWDMKL